MRVSINGRDFIKRREGVRYEPYLDVAGFPTVGVGHLLTGSVIKERYSEAEVDAFLEDDLDHVEDALANLVKVPLTQTYYDALASLIFNIGVNAFKRSTLLKLLNVGKYMQAADEFLKWRKAGGKVVPGLEKRREMERRLFVDGVYE